MGRVSGSTISAAVGRNPYVDPSSAKELVLGDKVLEKGELMALGLECEPFVRCAYERYSGNTVRAAGFAIPKWDHRIGVSVDGVACAARIFDRSPLPEDLKSLTGHNIRSEGIIEIKTRKGNSFPSWGEAKITRQEDVSIHDLGVVGYLDVPEEHFDQMQMGMAIFDLPWCDYLLYFPDDGRLYVQRVERDREHWKALISAAEPFIQEVSERCSRTMDGMQACRVEPPVFAKAS